MVPQKKKREIGKLMLFFLGKKLILLKLNFDQTKILFIFQNKAVQRFLQITTEKRFFRSTKKSLNQKRNVPNPGIFPKVFVQNDHPFQNISNLFW